MNIFQNYLQEDTGPHRSPGNQFHLIDTFAQTYDHIITLIMEEKNSDSIEEDFKFRLWIFFIFPSSPQLIVSFEQA